MCELNYRETKIKIGVKLGGSKVQFYLQKMKPLQGTTQTLTRVIDTWQSTFKVNGQHSNQASWTNFAGIYKIEAPNPKLEINWRPKVHFCLTF